MKNNAFGIKEVADVGLYEVGAISINSEGMPVVASGKSVKYVFDSLKVSSIEVGSEETSAKGGKGNPELISWSYGKTVNINVTDALMSMSTMSLLLGAEEGIGGANSVDAGKTLTITGNSFPGAYCVVGKAILRSFQTQKDELFYFVIPKAQFKVEGTVSMEADGDPSTFEMSAKALVGELTVGATVKTDVLVEFCRPGKALDGTASTVEFATPSFNFDGSASSTSLKLSATGAGFMKSTTIAVAGASTATTSDTAHTYIAAPTVSNETVTISASAATSTPVTVTVKDSSDNTLAIYSVTVVA